MHNILELIKLTKKSIRNKLIVMRHLDTHAVNLNEFLFHIKKKQLFEMHSLKKDYIEEFLNQNYKFLLILEQFLLKVFLQIFHV